MKKFSEFVNQFYNNPLEKLAKNYPMELKKLFKHAIEKGLIDDDEFLEDIKVVCRNLGEMPKVERPKEMDIIYRPAPDGNAAINTDW